LFVGVSIFVAQETVISIADLVENLGHGQANSVGVNLVPAVDESP
jgi:hypothetical protein